MLAECWRATNFAFARHSSMDSFPLPLPSVACSRAFSSNLLGKATCGKVRVGTARVGNGQQHTHSLASRAPPREEGQSSAHSDDGRRHPHPPPSWPANGVDVNREDSALSVPPCASVAMQRREAGQQGLQRTWRCVEVRSKMKRCECRVYQRHTTGQAKYGQARYSKAKNKQGTARPRTGKG